jgi:hypothetical protein
MNDPTRFMRAQARVPVETLCNEVIGERDQFGLVVDLSETGLRLQRPFRPGTERSRIVQLEFELPGVDEIIWAKGLVCFDQLWRGALRTSGVRLVAAATRHLRMLRDYVAAARPPLEDEDSSWMLLRASHWAG